VTVAVMIAAVFWLLNQPCGLYLRAIRDDELGARARGVRIVFWKVFAFSLSSGLTGLAGALFAHYLTLVSPSLGNPHTTGIVISMVVIGGMGTLIGPLLGAILIHVSSEFLRAVGDLHIIILALLVIFFARFCREGLWGRAVILLHRARSKTPVGVGGPKGVADAG